MAGRIVRPATPAFLAAVQASHQIAARVDILRDDDITLTLDTVTAGQVTLDQTAASRGRADLTLAVDPTADLIPDDATDPLAPYGDEMRVYRGVTYPDATVELVSLGIFRLDEVTVSDSGENLELRVSGLDRSARVIDARFETSGQIDAGTNVTTAIQTLLTSIGINALDLDATSHTTPLTAYEAGGDRWALAQDLAKAAGMDLYFDGDGVCVMRQITLAADNPVATLSEGDDGVLLTATRSWTRAGAFNAVIATGEKAADTAPPSGIAKDLNPASPTYYLGRFGQVPRFYSSPLLTTDAQCADAAASILAREIGTTQTIDFGAIVNPALEPGDVATITRERAKVTREAHVIDSLTIPLTHDQQMTGKTRAVQVAS